MKWKESTAYHVSEWLKAEFQARHVEMDDHFDTDSVLFYIDVDVVPRPVFQISEEALADFSPAEIIEILKRDEVVPRLRRNPTLRLFLDSKGQVPSFEFRIVECDDRKYRIVRDANHNVRVFDKDDGPLENLPTSLLVMPDSVHMKNVVRWCEEIRQWRGPNQ